MGTNQQTPQDGQKSGTQAVRYENISEQVLAKINQFQSDGGLTLPDNYSVENHMKSAWLVLQNTKDREGKAALEVCTKESIANSLLDMVLQGLAVSKKQGYFIVYGKKLEFQRSYFGSVALAKRAGGIQTEPVANVIYEGDDFVYSIDPKTGLMQIIKHDQKIENIDNTKIKAAYAVVQLPNGTTQVTIMSMKQIQAAWGQGATKGASPAHKNFGEEMAKKTVIGRACKMIINSSDDAWIYDGKRDEQDSDTPKEQRDSEIFHGKPDAVDVMDVKYEDVTHQHEEPAAEAPSDTEQVSNQPVEEDPGY